MLTEGVDYEHIAGLDAVPVGRSYATLREMTYASEALNIAVTVEAGFEFDGPTGMPLILGRWSRRCMRASLFHDGLYEPQGLVTVDCNRPLTRGLADKLFHEIAKRDGAPWLHRILAKTLIRWVGGRFWEDDNFNPAGG